MDFYKPIKDIYLKRWPIRVRISVTGIERPTVMLTIANKAPSTGVFVHSVRVHYGNKYFSRALTLMPAKKVMIQPKDVAEWILSFENEETILTERTLQKTQPRAPEPNRQPGIESPAQLFNAIGMGDKDHSWVEIDFNEYKEREYLKGKVKYYFDAVGKQHQEIRARNREMDTD